MDMALRKKNREIFCSLLDYAAGNKYDDDFLQLLIEFWQLLPENETEGNIFYAMYAKAHGNYEVALEYALKAYAKRKINWTLWCLLRDCYYASGNIEMAALFAAKADKLYNEPVNLDIPQDRLDKALNALSLGMGRGIYAPVAYTRMRITSQGMTGDRAIFAGEFLPTLGTDDEYHLFSAAYVETELQDDKGKLLSFMKDSPEMSFISGGDFTYDLIKLADRGNSFQVDIEDVPVVIGLVGSEEHQQVDFSCKQGTATTYLGLWANSFFRCEETTEVSSTKPLLCTAPIRLQHSPKRCKAVINVLLDGLCWRAVQERDYELVPNLMEFFRQGIIFNNHYSVSEYTYPSLATIETGLYPQHSQIFNDKVYHTLNREVKTISERMHDLGYYCVNIMGDSAGGYNGTMRGYDRMIVNCCGGTPLYVGIERIINHLEAFSETDQFIFLHASDTHLWSAHNYQLPLATQVKLDLQQRSLRDEKENTSVHLQQRDIYRHWNEQGIKNCDTNIARLLAYLKQNYAEDEYLLTLYSDHGSPIYGNSGYLLSEHQNSAAFMMRGHNVPQLGLVEELTSAVDLYPAIGACLGFEFDKVDGNLPEVLGGQKRDYTVSMSMYPPSPYTICLRTEEYECQAASYGCIDEDGRADLTEMKMDIYRRDNGAKVESSSIKDYFMYILQQECKEIDNNGTQWPDMKAARPEWFEQKE
ncbi:Sulfatase [Selenomonas ruminantium]|uniref:Sulfatase n=1 Tax=Selenomonas ruminantium TaxID=971 RepID=A0A1M6ULF5_SELRU|nr:Sulfatase [Selenomonas ruminantium]